MSIQTVVRKMSVNSRTLQRFAQGGQIIVMKFTQKGGEIEENHHVNSDSCQKDVREFKNLTTICSRWSNHHYEVHPIGGEIEETHHVVIVHKDLILVFSVLLS